LFYLPRFLGGENLKFRCNTNAFSIGSNSVVLVIPKDIAKELDIDVEKKKTHFEVWTDYRKDEKRIVYKLSRHAIKS